VFNEGLRTLPAIFGIDDTVHGYFPHHCNTPENHNYIGETPDITQVGVDNMKVEDVSASNTWYSDKLI
jgi:hypothetical protein